MKKIAWLIIACWMNGSVLSTVLMAQEGSSASESKKESLEPSEEAGMDELDSLFADLDELEFTKAKKAPRISKTRKKMIQKAPQPLTTKTNVSEEGNQSAVALSPKTERQPEPPLPIQEANPTQPVEMNPVSAEAALVTVPGQSAGSALTDLLPIDPLSETVLPSVPGAAASSVTMTALPEEKKSENKTTAEKQVEENPEEDTPLILDQSLLESKAEPKKKGPQKVESVVLFRLEDHLGEAEATYFLKKQNYPISGLWKNNIFSFTGLSPETEIKVSEGKFSGVAQRGIRLFAARDLMLRLRFSSVPAGERLRLQYGIEDAKVVADVPAKLYLRVWIGSHELRRVQIRNEKGWKEEIFPAGIAAFTHRATHITFEMTADIEDGKPFFLSAEVRT